MSRFEVFSVTVQTSSFLITNPKGNCLTAKNDNSIRKFLLTLLDSSRLLAQFLPCTGDDQLFIWNARTFRISLAGQDKCLARYNRYQGYHPKIETCSSDTENLKQQWIGLDSFIKGTMKSYKDVTPIMHSSPTSPLAMVSFESGNLHDSLKTVFYQYPPAVKTEEGYRSYFRKRGLGVGKIDLKTLTPVQSFYELINEYTFK